VQLNLKRPPHLLRHKDSENPQLVRVGKGKPVISFSIGLSCEFGYKGEPLNVEMSIHEGSEALIDSLVPRQITMKAKSTRP
jgi:hypothetical protein